ncbi:MAG: VCBS repeat-containing protein [Planctomycetota bacterium]
MSVPKPRHSLPRFALALAVTVAPTLPAPAQTSPTDVPLRLWTSAEFPAGVVFGDTRGITVGDYDGDRWPDVFAAFSAELWRNLGGAGWQRVADLDRPPTAVMSQNFRYGASFGDYDNDGLPDLAIEPRLWPRFPARFELLHNRGDATFAQVAAEGATIISSPQDMDAESICWGDVDGDGDLDLFVPAYPIFTSGFGTSGNVFWTNQGPTGPGGAYRFDDTTTTSGLANPLGTERPEGAQLCDIDGDGDLDLYSNGTLYQNVSTLGVPSFVALDEAASGIGLRDQLDEGAVFCDYDLDGDFDLFVTYWDDGVILWESRGDGTFFREDGVVQSSLVGKRLGISVADWDNDGDLDLTSRHVFRRNFWAETGQRMFSVATHSIPAAHISSATPSWLDWDRDGDLDCALGNWAEKGRLYENHLYDATTPLAGRRYVRVRPLRGTAAVPAGLSNEFGARVQVHIPDGPARERRVRFTSSSGGYLNQDEYALHFALPADPLPARPETDVRLQVTTDFPGVASAGLHRVDHHVNPLLDLDLADLTDREIDVFRDGRVVRGGCDLRPTPMEAPTLHSSGGGSLAVPTMATPLPRPMAAPGSDWWVGIELDTTPASGSVRVHELVIDGQLDTAVAGPGRTGNVFLWDVTEGTPAAVEGAVLNARSSSRNDRTVLALGWLLDPGRTYRIIARVTSLRATPFAGPTSDGPMTTRGGLSYQDALPSSPTGVGAAVADARQLFLAVRARAAQVDVWTDLGMGLAGAVGVPTLSATGAAAPRSRLSIQVDGAAPGSSVVLVFGRQLQCAPFLGGTLLPRLETTLGTLTDASGRATIPAIWPKALGSGRSLFLQALVVDAGAPQGLAFTNGLWIVAP